MGIFGKTAESRSPEPGPARPQPAAAGPQGAPAPKPSPACVIGAKTVVKGEISGEEDVLVEGTVEGQVRIARDLRVGQGGTVKATLEVQSLIVSGEVVGDCVASARVEIQSTGRVTGNLRAPRIVIAEGAVFKGNSDMSPRKDERKDKPAGV